MSFAGATLFLFGPLALAGVPELRVDTDFPGGSAKVETLDQEERSIRLLPADHPGRGWACWWHFKVSGVAPGETLTIDVGEAPWATPDRAAFSLDGKTWRHTAPGERNGKRIVYRHQVDAEEAHFAWGPPFVLSDAQALAAQTGQACAEAEKFVLCESREGRPTPAVQFTPAEQGQAPRAVWIQARQHAWESGASWIAKGLADWLASDDPRAQRLRQSVEVTLVPIMDVDNVERGAGGKNETPQDHNRDWSDEPHWAAVAAAQKRLRQLDSAERLAMFIDLHNPGASDREPYFYIPPDELLTEAGQRQLDHFLQCARLEITGPLAFRGRTIASGRQYDPKLWEAISKNWVAANCREEVVSVTLETPWNTPHSHIAGWEQVGRELGLAIERYLRDEAQAEADSGP